MKKVVHAGRPLSFQKANSIDSGWIFSSLRFLEQLVLWINQKKRNTDDTGLDPDKNGSFSLAQSLAESHNRTMTEKEIVLATIQSLPDDCSLEEIAERIEFMAAVQKGLDQLDRGEGIPHEEVKRQLASWLTN